MSSLKSHLIWSFGRGTTMPPRESSFERLTGGDKCHFFLRDAVAEGDGKDKTGCGASIRLRTIFHCAKRFFLWCADTHKTPGRGTISPLITVNARARFLWLKRISDSILNISSSPIDTRNKILLVSSSVLSFSSDIAKDKLWIKTG